MARAIFELCDVKVWQSTIGPHVELDGIHVPLVLNVVRGVGI